MTEHSGLGSVFRIRTSHPTVCQSRRLRICNTRVTDGMGISAIPLCGAELGRRAGMQVLPLISLLFSFSAQAFELQMPIDCTIGVTCAIQNYVDVDPSPRAVDFSCGSLTYDGHNGTDFRLPDLATQQRGVNVLAAANGR